MHTNLKSGTYPVANLSGFKRKVLNWLRPFNTFCFLDNQQYTIEPHGAECLIAAGEDAFLSGNDIRAADTFFKQTDWVFGHLAYDLKNTLHHLPGPDKKNLVGFAPFYFFRPQVVLHLTGTVLTIHAEDPGSVYNSIVQQPDAIAAPKGLSKQIIPVLSKEAYIEKIKALQSHIQRGDCYEINFCQEFYASDAALEPFGVFHHLMQVSPNPFSAFYRLQNRFLLCASPERFLAKNGSRLVSQPIKGTVRRNLLDAKHDRALKESLRLSAKEQAENVMVVDLVRNDLTQVCNPASVTVDELFGLYTFPQVHQMISTISGELKKEVLFSEIIQATFPMGSMTGAPKHSVMKLIDAYEPSARGLFSGSVGYKSPDGNFDFNVVIRSIFYNAVSRYLSYQVGSGITYYCNPEQEWEECMLKAEAIKKVLTKNTPALPA